MLNWLDSRTGMVTMTKDFLTEDVPGGASYWYAFGSATVFAMLMQIATGIFLTFYYSPSAATAWESTKYIIEKVPAGTTRPLAPLLGRDSDDRIHDDAHAPSSAVGRIQKAARTACGSSASSCSSSRSCSGSPATCCRGISTHCSHPRSRFRSRARHPIAGQAVLLFLQDGSGIGTLTINRFFGIHVWLTPAVLIAARRFAPRDLPLERSGRCADRRSSPKLKPGRFWPDQMFMDTVVSFAMFVIVFLLAVFSPAPLDAKADPNNTQFVPYPAWYFMALFSLLDVVGNAPSWAVELPRPVRNDHLPDAPHRGSHRAAVHRQEPQPPPLAPSGHVLTLTGLVLGGAIVLSFVGQYHVQRSARCCTASTHRKRQRRNGTKRRVRRG